MLARGYIKSTTWEKRAFAVFDCETLERQNEADSAIEATLSLVSISVCDTMTRTPWFGCVDDDTEINDSEEGDDFESQNLAKQKLSKF